ncbi:MAG: toll/interleukin-1 receptor domain-containing protein, partial [Thermoleophilaceae bacterium]|nr:toll/interleukin-1 receptor domain-containing protein [Thermoleophilaceae bacterium]
MYDVFISHRWGTQGTHGGPAPLQFARDLKDALKARGVSVFLDETEIKFGDVLSDEVRAALPNSKLIVPVLSVDYFDSLACTTELMHFFRAGLKPSNVVNRVVPVDIAPGNGQAHYVDTPLYWRNTPRIKTGDDIADLVDQLIERGGECADPIGNPAATSFYVYGEHFRDDLFTGRNRELLQVYRALFLDDNRMTNTHGTQAQIVGMPGQGKTMLAHQFVEW